MQPSTHGGFSKADVRSVVARTCRALSYLIASLIAVSLVYLSGSQPTGHAPGGTVASMGSIGVGIGEALVVFFVSAVGAFMIGATNLGAYLLSPKPKPRWRKVELALFLTPFALVLVFVLLVIALRSF